MDLRRRYGKIILPILLGAFLLITGMIFLRLRGGVVVKADQEDIYAGEVTVYRQDDEAWADEPLGNSSFTMKSSGCLVTCIASAVSMETGQEITPGALNRLFSSQEVYDGEGNIQWAAIDGLGGYSTEIYGEVSVSEIDRCLAAGRYPIVRVRVNGIGNYHYVLIVGIEDQDYVCMDPLQNELTKLSRYWRRVYAVRVVSTL